MNQEQKLNLDLDISNLFKELVNKDNPVDAAMYVRGDAEFQHLTVNLQGDARVLAQAFHVHMGNNQEFKRLIFSIVGTYLSKNPQDEFEFNEGVKLVKQSFGIN